MTKRDEAARLMEELRQHQIELEMQNDELRAARAEIEGGLHRYTELFDFAPVGYIVLDPSGILLETNLEFARMVGRARKRLGGWPFAKYVDPPYRAALVELLRKRFCSTSDQPAASLEIALSRDGAEPLPVRLLVSTHASPRPSNKPSLLVAVFDMTATRQAQLAREQLTQKDEFLATLSHELRNPLFPVATSVAVLRRAEPGSPQASHAIETIDRQVSHLVHIVDDLLDVTRIARGKISLRRERIDLRDLLGESMEDHRPEFAAKGIALVEDLEHEPVWVDADPTRLVQVAGNLLVNASKFTPSGGRVQLGLRSVGTQAVFWVRDNGAGIAEDIRDQLFVPFIQAPQTLERSRGGLGLGLAMVKGLVELHGGSVDVVSDGPGHGSEFQVRLPLAEGPATHAAPVAPAAAVAARRVLVIEDNVDAADMIRDLIIYEGHDARTAYEGPTGLALAKQFHPQIVFCDIGLPGMDGYAVARAMRADPELSGAYLVALSGYALPEDRRRSAEAGFDCHIAKPPSEQELERVLSR